MRVFALGDPHLSFGRPKPMDVFGEIWRDHPATIAARWDATVGADDVVLVVGDVSWARTLDEARPDLEFIAARAGALKVLLRGNHDSWWSAPKKVRAALPAGLAILHHDALRLDAGVVLCGARGWEAPGMPWYDAAKDHAIFERELQRLDLSLETARSLAQPGDALVAALHYPPLAPGAPTSPVVDRLARAGVAAAAYGHLHGTDDHAWAPCGVIAGVHFHFVAADAVGFTPQQVWPIDRGASG